MKVESTITITLKDLLKPFIEDIHSLAKEKGWWEKERSFGDVLSLIHSELSEALEFERSSNKLIEKGIDPLLHYTGSIKVDTDPEALNKMGYGKQLSENIKVVPVSDIEIASNVETENTKKPDGTLAELADAIIRIFDYVGSIDKVDEFVDVLIKKHEFNKTRPYKHGKKF